MSRAVAGVQREKGERGLRCFADFVGMGMDGWEVEKWACSCVMGVLGGGDGDGVWACVVVEWWVCMKCTPSCGRAFVRRR